MRYKSFIFILLLSLLLTPLSVAVAATPPGFKVDQSYYPSPINPNFLSDGTLVRETGKPTVYYITGGKRSVVLDNVLGRWFGENHYYKSDIIMNLSATDIARYPMTTAVNKMYIGKVLQAPNGAQFYIDDKLRKRPLSAAVRTKLKFPAKNLYATAFSHLEQFKLGPALKGDLQPGGMIIYDGPFHGGRIWKLEEALGGKITKRLYLGDYFYEADGYPDESQRVAVSATELAKYPRGNNISHFPTGWLVGKGTTISLVQNDALRRIATPTLFAAMGYVPKQVQTVFPQFITTYAQGIPVAAFKTLVDKATIAANPVAAPAPNTAYNLLNVRPAIRTLIANVNNIGLTAYDRELTVDENKFWVNYVYSGEVSTQDALARAMRNTKATGKFPALTPRTTPIDPELLKSKWFPYLFYFVWHKEPTDDDRSYWFGRIHAGDRDTIEKLGGTIQWLKETSGLTHK